MIFIDIDSTLTKTKSGINERGQWSMVFQQCSISGHYQDGFPAKHPRETTIQLDDKEPKPYPPGRYVMSADSFYFGNFDRFTLGRIKPQPIADFIAEFENQTGAKITFNKAA